MAKKHKFVLADVLPKSAEMTVVHPVHGDIGLTITLNGSHDPKVHNKALMAMGYFRVAQDETNPEKLAEVVTKVEDVSAEAAAAAIVGWSDDEIMGGSYSEAYALELMRHPGFGWLKEQINAFVGEKKNFFRIGG